MSCEKVAVPSNVTGFTIASFEIYGTAVMVTLPLSSITVPIEMPSRSPVRVTLESAKAVASPLAVTYHCDIVTEFTVSLPLSTERSRLVIFPYSIMKFGMVFV